MGHVSKTSNIKKKISEDWELMPRCLSEKRRAIAYVNTGHLSPCCWVDGDKEQASEDYKMFFTEELKVANNDKVEDIIESETWLNFFKSLTEDPKNAPASCWKNCGQFAVEDIKGIGSTPNRDQYNVDQEGIISTFKDQSVTRFKVLKYPNVFRAFLDEKEK